VVILVVVLVLATILVWRLTAARRDAAGRPVPRFVAPDDDPDFLRELDRRTRRDDETS